MPQKLSAMNYIKNNKRRAAVLIVSLGLCFVLTYLTQFLLSSSWETMGTILTEQTKKCQYLQLSFETMGLDTENEDHEKLLKQYNEKNREIAEKLKTHKGVRNVFFTKLYYCTINTPISSFGYEIPALSKEEIPELIDYMGAKLISGRMPENPGEMVLDKASVKNGGFVLDGYFNELRYDKDLRIVGILDCDVYFGCCIAKEDKKTMMLILSDIEDIAAELAEEGIYVTNKNDGITDLKWGNEYMKTEVTDAFEGATKYVYAGIIILLSISLIIVYTMYLRDRRNEWCLYSSIGYSRRAIYFSIMRELLFTFGAALLMGGVLVAASVVILNKVMIEPEGLRCRFFHPDTLWEIFCSYVLILGILHIPVRYALNRIRTIDAMDELN